LSRSFPGPPVEVSLSASVLQLSPREGDERIKKSQGNTVEEGQKKKKNNNKKKKKKS
jgi:hypothetical protein